MFRQEAYTRGYIQKEAIRGPRLDGSGKGEGQPNGLRQNKNPDPCPVGGPGYGEGEGRGEGVNRDKGKISTETLKQLIKALQNKKVQ